MTGSFRGWPERAHVVTDMSVFVKLMIKGLVWRDLCLINCE